MKYMGSKRWMLSNGLGDLLTTEAPSAERFVDLFSGSAAVSWHVATKTNVPVVAVDLQVYSAVLGLAVLGRTRTLGSTRILERWVSDARSRLKADALYDDALLLASRKLSRTGVFNARKLCAKSANPIAASYGGYYYSPHQALTLDALRATLPASEPSRSVCLASLIWAATRCVAAPGHTAQPFQPTPTALPFIKDAWSRDAIQIVNEVLPMIAGLKAQARGRVITGDATEIARVQLTKNDLVFLDPPYSAAQYSRFYHVLETVARGSCSAVDGVGRYPPTVERPKSLFSLKGQAQRALDDLLVVLREKGCRVIMTFPQQPCSNGLVGDDVVRTAREWYEVDITAVAMRHSTLGGNNSYRASRRATQELIMVMRPRQRGRRR